MCAAKRPKMENDDANERVWTFLDTCKYPHTHSETFKHPLRIERDGLITYDLFSAHPWRRNVFRILSRAYFKVLHLHTDKITAILKVIWKIQVDGVFLSVLSYLLICIPPERPIRLE